MSESKGGLKRGTHLDRDGSNDADLVTLSSPQVLREIVIFKISRIVFRFAARGYDRLGGQVDNMRQTPVQINEFSMNAKEPSGI